MAQTTRLASFGPFFVVLAQLVIYSVTSTCVYNRILVGIRKKPKANGKYLPMAQTTRLASFGPVSATSDLPVSILRKIRLYVDKTLISI